MHTIELSFNVDDCELCLQHAKEKAEHFFLPQPVTVVANEHHLLISGSACEQQDRIQQLQAMLLSLEHEHNEHHTQHSCDCDHHHHDHSDHHDHSVCACEENHHHIHQAEGHHDQGEQTLLIDGLDCAHCANKLERVLNARPDVCSATVSFVSSKVYLSMRNGTLDDAAINDIERELNQFEPVKLRREHQEKHVEEIRKYGPFSLPVWQIIVGVIILIMTFAYGETNWILPLALAGYFFIGFDVLRSAWNNIRSKDLFDENFLMSIATIGAFFIHEYPEAIGVMLFYKVGEYVQDKAVERSRTSIQNLLDIKPDYANVMHDEEIIKVNPETVAINEHIFVYPSERIPLDGTIIKGHSMLDTSSLTGESVPAEVEPGESVLSGSINLKSTLEIQVTTSYEQSTVKKLIDLIENASLKKASTEKFITRFSKIYTPIVVLLAAVVIIAVGIINRNFYAGLERGLILLVISCPCALVISTPLGFFAGMGKSSKEGILVKGGEAIENLNAVDTIVFDKTGTLTKGNFAVVEVVSAGQFSEDELLALAALVESQSHHPIAQSIMRAYHGKLDYSRVQSLSENVGRGIEARIDGDKHLYVGNLKGLEELNADPVFTRDDATLVYVVVNGISEGYIVIEDELKDSSIQAISALKNNYHISTRMLSGDKRSVASRIGSVLGIDVVEAELLPDQKVASFQQIKENSTHKVAYVGDGMNDAAVLAMSDVGIAMGQVGNDLAIESADIVIMNDDPLQIETAIRIARKTVRVVKQTILFILIVKAIIMGMGIFDLANMWLAVFADVGVSLLAIVNAMRILR